MNDPFEKSNDSISMYYCREINFDDINVRGDGWADTEHLLIVLRRRRTKT